MRELRPSGRNDDGGMGSRVCVQPFPLMILVQITRIGTVKTNCVARSAENKMRQ